MNGGKFTGSRGKWVGSTKDDTASLDSIGTLPDHRDDGARVHVGDQPREEGFAGEISIVYEILNLRSKDE
jgi:hypothetical protein